MSLMSWVCLLAALVSLAFAVAQSHSRETEIYHVSAGHLFLLRCLNANASTNVTWSRAGRRNLGLPTGVEVKDGLLWFLPMQTSHDGTYTCEKRDETGLSGIKFRVLVSTRDCPDPLENKTFTKGVSGVLPCKQREIFRLNYTRKIRWMKDCHPVEPTFGDDNYLRLPVASERDAGKYTCFVDIILEGRKYTAARSIQLSVKNEINSMIVIEPEVVSPQKEVVIVKVGSSTELKCLAYIGFHEDSNTIMYWTINGTYIEDHEGLEESWKYTHDKHRVYGLSILSISKVLPQFLNVPILCTVMNSVGKNVCSVLLQEADYSALYTTAALCLAAYLIVQTLTVIFLFFRIDVVLAYRKLTRHFSKQAEDGKLYDGYVSFLHAEAPSSAETVRFALQVLPKELEKKHGYSLYIRGRDDCPGEAVHDIIAATVRQCRTLILILSTEGNYSAYGETWESSSLCNDRSHLFYEQKIGIYDALTNNDPRVILVEIDGPVDYSHLPQSLHYIKRKQGALKWKRASLGTCKLARLCSNRNFWKNLRYHMPSVPAGRPRTTVQTR